MNEDCNLPDLITVRWWTYQLVDQLYAEYDDYVNDYLKAIYIAADEVSADDVPWF